MRQITLLAAIAFAVPSVVLQPSPAVAQDYDTAIITYDVVAAASLEDHDRINQYTRQKDWRAVALMQLQGRAIIFEEGERVYRGGCAGFLCRAYKIRRPGDTREWYVPTSAIDIGQQRF